MSSVSNFFSRDSLKRQRRTARIPALIPRSSSLKGKKLHIIPEEIEEPPSRSTSPYAASTSSGGSYTLGVKSKRRHANVVCVSDIRIARDAPVHDDTECDPALLSAPRPAPLPPRGSPIPSPDSFSLTFTDVSFQFPHPPIPTPTSLKHHHHRSQSSCASPSPSMTSMSSSSSSAESETTGMPTTPSSSDDEFSFSIPTINTRRASIKPLVIAKRAGTSPFSEESPRISANRDLLQPFKNAQEAHPHPASPGPSENSWYDSESESEEEDGDSDSEWYTRELSTFFSPLSSSSDTAPSARPESIALPPTTISSTPARTTTVGGPNTQLDPLFPHPHPSSPSKKRRIPSYLPPPVPPIPEHLKRSVSNTSIVGFPMEAASPSSPLSFESTPVFLARTPTAAFTAPRTPPRPSPHAPPSSFRAPSIRRPRPPPRSSMIPADCVFDDDDASVFSFSMYAEEIMPPAVVVSAPGASPIVEEEEAEGGEVVKEEEGEGDDMDDGQELLTLSLSDTDFDLDLDYHLMLPLSLPGSPIDLEREVVLGLEELWRVRRGSASSRGSGAGRRSVDAGVSEGRRGSVKRVEESVTGFVLALPDTPAPTTTTTPSSKPEEGDEEEEEEEDVFIFPPTPSSSSPSLPSLPTQGQGLKSKWSSSTLASVREEHASKRGGASKLRLYFGSPTKKTAQSPALRTPPRTPSKKHTSSASSSYFPTSPSPSPFSPGFSLSPSSPSSPSPERTRPPKRDSDAYPHPGVRRQASIGGAGWGGSECGSEDSASSSGSMGLRRKPIPVEMFLRSAV